MARTTFPRPQHLHEAQAAKILRRHALLSGESISLPVPIEMIIEQTFGLSVVYDEVDEPPNEMILGALSPTQRLITLNSKHAGLFGKVLGPERFTLAHELGHWVYDADDPGQLTLDAAHHTDVQFCYHRARSHDLPSAVGIREVNANKLAATLLMPRYLLLEADLTAVLADIRGTAARWGVSREALQIRLQALGLGGRGDTPTRS